MRALSPHYITWALAGAWQKETVSWRRIIYTIPGSSLGICRLPGSSPSSSILRLQEYSTAFLYSTSTLSCPTPFYAFAVSTSPIFYHRLIVYCTSLYLREYFDINLSNRRESTDSDRESLPQLVAAVGLIIPLPRVDVLWVFLKTPQNRSCGICASTCWYYPSHNRIYNW